MTKRFILAPALFACVAMLAPSIPARAGILFDSGVELNDIANAISSDLEFPHLTGSAFTLATASILEQIEWTGIYNGIGGDGIAPETDDFTIEIYDFSDATPATTPLFSFHIGNAVNRTDTGSLLHGSMPIFSYSAAVPGTALDPGRYLLSIVADTSGDPGDFFGWSYRADGTFSLFGRASAENAWGGSYGQAADFTLLGTTAAVPEPASFAMMAIGLGSLAFGLRWRAARC